MATLAAADGPQKVYIPSNHPIYHKRYNARDYPLDSKVHRGFVLRYDVPSKNPADDPDPADVDAWIEHGTFANLPLSNRHNLVKDANCKPSGFVLSACRVDDGIEVEFALRTDTPEGQEALQKLASGEFRALSLTHDGNRPLEVALCTTPYRDRCVITADADGKNEVARLKFTGHGPDAAADPSWIRPASEPAPVTLRPAVAAAADAKTDAKAEAPAPAPAAAATPSAAPASAPALAPAPTTEPVAIETKLDEALERTFMRALTKLQTVNAQAIPSATPAPVTINNYMHPGAPRMPYEGHVPGVPAMVNPLATAPTTLASTVCVHSARAYLTSEQVPASATTTATTTVAPMADTDTPQQAQVPLPTLPSAVSDADAALQQQRFEAQREQLRQEALKQAAAATATAPDATGAAPMADVTETKTASATESVPASAPAAAAETKAAAATPAPAAVSETKTAEPSIPFEKLKASIATIKSLLSSDSDPSLDFVCKRANEGDFEAFDHLMQMLKRSKRAKNEHVATAASVDTARPAAPPAPAQAPPAKQVNMASWMPGHTPTAVPPKSATLESAAPPSNVRQVVMCMADDAMVSSTPLKDFEKRAANWRHGLAGESLRKWHRDAVDQYSMVKQAITQGARVVAAPNRNATVVMASADEFVFNAPYPEKYGVPSTFADMAGQTIMAWLEGNHRARALSAYNEHKRRLAKGERMHGRDDDVSVY